MQILKRALTLAAMPLLLSACSHKPETNSVLSHVPGNTPWLFANLKPLDPAVRDAWLATVDAQIPARVSQYRNQADMIEDEAPQMAAWLRIVAKEMHGKTWKQLFEHEGMDMNGHFALYGLGLSPVLRGQLTDPAKFDALLERIGKGIGITASKSHLQGVDYRHLDFAEQHVQLVIAHHEQQFIVALLPVSASPEQLRLTLGLSQPEHPERVLKRLQKLQDDKGYTAYGLAYLDIARLLGAFTSAENRLVKTFMSDLMNQTSENSDKLQTLNSPACQSDFARIAARAPLMSFGYTGLSKTHADYRFDLQLAPDIVSAFKSVQSSLPGLGGGNKAPLDLAIALPVPEFRDFWSAQAKAVAKQPFTCHALALLNDMFAKIGSQMQNAAIPPFGNLRGVRLAIDDIQFAVSGSERPLIQARLLVALKDPASVLAMAQSMLPAIKKIQFTQDGKPVALPKTLTDSLQQGPAWASMNDKTLAVAVGDGENDKLAGMLADPDGGAGQFVSGHLQGAAMVRWIQAFSSRTGTVKAADPAQTRQQKISMKASMDVVSKTYQHIDYINSESHMGQNGLVSTGSTVAR